MEPFVTFTAVVAPLDRANVDTDAIIPKQFLKTIRRTGLGAYLFDEWRFEDPGEPGKPPEARVERPDFILNREGYRNAGILLARANFGCGSSREHAPWALLDFGIRCVIAPSFADIFFNNCFKNGILPVVLPEAEVDDLFARCDPEAPGAPMEATVDLPQQTVVLADGSRYRFEVDPFRKECLLAGKDDIDLTLAHEEAIAAYERRRRREAPWLFADLAA
ncbi:MAG: 3-isopropylmalate dehydratase small subunit [Nitrospirae bacterium]|nr:MAG: 3-isopropylmalate dehydratase small subunit [Nitrospirota bacterium]